MNKPINVTDEGKPATKEDFKLLMGLFIGLAVVAGFAVITLVIQYFTATQATYQHLVDKVNEQNIKIDLMLGQKVDWVYKRTE
jgi:hypothetical protein